jgi:hypothetical protein
MGEIVFSGSPSELQTDDVMKSTRRLVERILFGSRKGGGLGEFIVNAARSVRLKSRWSVTDPTDLTIGLTTS